MRITFLCPHLRIGGGVRAILTYADRLARRGHEVTLVTPAQGALTAWWRNFKRAGPEWIAEFRPSVVWVREWSAASLPNGDVLVATAWQSAEPV